MKPKKKTARGKRAARGARVPPRKSQTPAHRVREEKPVPSSATAESAVQEPSFKIPPILLEGDEPSPPAAGGPGQRYALGPTPPLEAGGAAGEPGELPEAYGTGK